MNRYSLALLSLLLAAGLPGCARAQALVDLQLRDLDQSQTLPRYPFRGQDYVAGQPGHRYAVVLQNLTGERVLAVVSVDGVNAISGQTAGSQQSGYVLEPWQRLEVRGWRKNLSEVAEFQFTSLEDSYAARTGRPRNVGVVGVAAFRERRPAPIPYDYQDRISAAEPAAAPPAASADRAASGALAEQSRARSQETYAPQQKLGTGHGQRRWDSATLTQFERESSRPNQVLSLYYDAAEVLAARGIIPRPSPYYGSPEAFPIGFAPDPR
jgi:hypothetical protein